MALSITRFPHSFPSTVTSRAATAEKPPTILFKHAPTFRRSASKPRYFTFTAVTKASAEDEITAAEESAPAKDEMTELGKEIKLAMKEREEQKEPGFVSGVIEEIREIEWPAFNKVLGTTGVVLGVIAGSSIVLLSVNAVLAEISDTIFAGKGVQDFFG